MRFSIVICLLIGLLAGTMQTPQARGFMPAPDAEHPVAETAMRSHSCCSADAMASKAHPADQECHCAYSLSQFIMTPAATPPTDHSTALSHAAGLSAQAAKLQRDPQPPQA